MTTGHAAGVLDLHESSDRGGHPSGADLARSMLLLRASNMNVMRLQLAMERRDRRQALEALDDLVAIDSEIRGLVEDMPINGTLGEMARRLDDQKAVLASEKLIFAAGKTGPALAPKAEIAPAPLPTLEAEAVRSLKLPSQPDGETAPEWIPAYLMEEEKTSRKGRFALMALGALLLIPGGAAAVHFLGLVSLAPVEAAARLWGGL
jgi:hypothetical protein